LTNLDTLTSGKTLANQDNRNVASHKVH